MGKEQRYIKKTGIADARILGWTDALFMRTDMVECDVDGNILDVEGSAAPEHALQARIQELEVLLAKSDNGALLMDLESAQQTLEAANSKLEELTEENAGLTTQVADLESQLANMPDAPVASKSEQLETFMLTLKGMGDTEKKQALDKFSTETLDVKLDGRYAFDKMVEQARAGVKEESVG